MVNVSNYLIILLESVQHGQTQNWLIFKGYIPQQNTNRLYEFKYCGTELNTNSYLTDDFKEQLRHVLNEKFGHPPFRNISEIQNKLNEMDGRVELKY